MHRDRRTIALGLALLGAAGAPAMAGPQDLAVSAQVDRTAADVGEPVTLTVTLSGDLNGAKVEPLELPPYAFAVAAQSQSTNVSFGAGGLDRSTSLVYVLLPQREGTFKLGPFTVEHRKKEFQTAPIEITVKKSALPPKLQPQGERFTL